MPTGSKIFFALSILALLITAVIQVIGWFQYKKELMEYRRQLGKWELQEAKRKRLEKEAEVIRLFNEQQKQKSIENGEFSIEN